MDDKGVREIMTDKELQLLVEDHAERIVANAECGNQAHFSEENNYRETILLNVRSGLKYFLRNYLDRCEILRRMPPPPSRQQAHYVAEVHPAPESPSCHVCGALMVPDGFMCKSCGATTKLTPPEAITSKAASAPPEEGWISVSERLPEIGANVLVYKPERWKQPFVVVCYSEDASKHRELIRRDGQWWDSGCQITYWQPLPSPPQREGKEKV